MKDLRAKLKLNAAATQITIGLEDNLSGLVDVICRKAFRFDGPKGDIIVEIPVPDNLKESMETTRSDLIERLAEVDETIGEFFLEGKEPPVDTLKAAIRRCTIAQTFVPVFMGSAYKNKGVQVRARDDGLIGPTRLLTGH